MKLVARNKARRESGQSTGSGSSAKKTPKSGGGVQVGLHAFFNKRPSSSEQQSAAKRQKTPPTSPDHSVEPEVITID